jgi:hypothetical protein
MYEINERLKNEHGCIKGNEFRNMHEQDLVDGGADELATQNDVIEHDAEITT